MRLANGACTCGRTFRRLEGGILGRIDDMLFIRGVGTTNAAVGETINIGTSVTPRKPRGVSRVTAPNVHVRLAGTSSPV